MNDPIEQDDQKLKGMFMKQHPYGPPDCKSNDVIENDDTRLDDLLILQSIGEDNNPNYKSIEQKYEEEIAFKEITDLINSRLKDKGEGQED